LPNKKVENGCSKRAELSFIIIIIGNNLGTLTFFKKKSGKDA
jgi:hypothetical protein